MGQREEVYTSYLLRVWRKRQAGALHVRLVLTSTSSGAEWHFVSMQSLIQFLADPAPRPPEAPAPGVP
jgi:hypothetical protein